jgi:hypothetical protein
MRDSLYSYCFFHCPLDALFTSRQFGLFGGVVGVDHYYTHQGMPCHAGQPDEFKAQDSFAIATKARFPKACVLQYRITDAVPYAPIVHNKMLSDADWMARRAQQRVGVHRTRRAQYSFKAFLLILVDVNIYIQFLMSSFI